MREELFADSEAYEIAKALVQRAINTDQSKGGDVHILDTDFATFRKNDEEKSKLYTMRNAWREAMRTKYGPTWTKRGASRSWSSMN